MKCLYLWYIFLPKVQIIGNFYLSQVGNIVTWIPFTWQIESFIFFSSEYAGNIYFNINIILTSTSFVDKIFISTMPCGHLFIISSIFSTKIFISKKLQPPPPPVF